MNYQKYLERIKKTLYLWICDGKLFTLKHPPLEIIEKVINNGQYQSSNCSSG